MHFDSPVQPHIDQIMDMDEDRPQPVGGTASSMDMGSLGDHRQLDRESVALGRDGGAFPTPARGIKTVG